MIILTQSQRDFLLELKTPYVSLLRSRMADFNPIEILPDNNGAPRYILPEAVRIDARFSEIMAPLEESGFFDQVEIRAVLPEEFIQYSE